MLQHEMINLRAGFNLHQHYNGQNNVTMHIKLRIAMMFIS